VLQEILTAQNYIFHMIVVFFSVIQCSWRT